MEYQNPSNSSSKWDLFASPKVSIILIGFFSACYVAILPMAGTIALRNLVLMALCISLIWIFRKSRPLFFWPMPILLWTVYLLLFSFFSDSLVVTLHSLVSQWGRGLLAIWVGAGVAAVFYRRNIGSALHLGLISAVPIVIHLVLFAWKAWDTSSIPWGYWGRETHHADLGYAAGQAVVLLAAALAVRRGPGRRWALGLIIACLLSTALANSRAGFMFTLGGGFLVVISVYVARSTYRPKHVLFAMVGLLIAGMVFFSVAFKEDSRWPNMTADLSAGFLGNAIQIECEGTSSIEPQILAKYGSGEKSQSVISSVQGGDGARVAVLRAAIALVIKHPWGSDGSKFAYQHLLKEECPEPVILMAHAHNGWIDTILALGWAGGGLYFMVLANFVAIGYTSLRRSVQLNEWAIVLVAMASFWILRGSVDSVFKDHMLEMQGFVLSYAASHLWLQRQASVSSIRKN